MATAGKNLSDFGNEPLPDAKGFRFGIVVAEWNREVTGKLLEGAVNTLLQCGASEKDIQIIRVPGTFELPLGATWLAEEGKSDAVICLGCVIQGETPHFTYICQGVTQGITELNLRYKIPFVFGVLTTLNLQQAIDRAGGKYGNKGDEAALTALKMLEVRKNLKH
ncbi:MAG TPA: 6,7-dimethyl-8-ribityllumazine synthase [Bacteroidales bacterium]|nr:6,7-dimethyl-8-ribityllumazine synthase [Bacteroidales bacterium]HQK36662.1 6,7-dimethyl-8-ribityllumazine synthase [Bacteroidales bacterium]